jgi:ElaB/YqjD/DUF883 family membrane-anchored ribosome-binding protein
MSSDFKQLIADIEQEAQDQGPQAVNELNRLREEVAQAGDAIQRRLEGKASDGAHGQTR